MKHHKQVLQNSQVGLVSILVTIIIMLVISLIVLGFARIVRREQRQALDRQLNTQAFYAAESGINEAIKTIKTDLSTPTGAVPKTTCDPGTHYPAPTLDATSGIAFTCLLVNPKPDDLKYDTVSTKNSTVVPVKAAGGVPIGSITLNWQETPTPASLKYTGCPAVGKFPTKTSWPADCNAGILRVDLVPSAGTLCRIGSCAAGTSLEETTMTAFFYPDNTGTGAGDLVYNTAKGFGGQGAVWKSKCNGNPTKLCSATISGLGATSYHLRLKSIYKDNSVLITAKDLFNNSLSLVGTQVIVDATGKANDVLRRIQVRLPVTPASGDSLPEFAIESVDTLCKRMKIIPGDTPPVTFDASDAACTP